MTTADSPAVIRAWRAYRRWRRGRPFWGGLFAILAGLEIFGTTQSLEGMEIKIGVEGFQSILIPLMLVLAGILAWATPAQRHFYGVITVFVAVYSFIGVNFGGFFIGMLFGIIGGSLIFAWAPAKPDVVAETEIDDEDEPPGRHAAPQETVNEVDRPARDHSTQPANPFAIPQQRPPVPAENDPEMPRRSPRLFAVVFVPLVLVATGIIALKTQEPALAACTTPRRTATASPTSTPTTGTVTPAPPATSAAAPAQGGGGLVGEIIDFLGGLLGGNNRSSASPTPTATQQPTGTPTAGTPRRTTPPTRCPTPSPTVTAKHLKADADQFDVALKPGRMTGSSITMVNLNFRGIVDLPTANGTITVLKFTLDSSTTDDFTLRIYGGARDVLQSTKALTVKQNVVFYTNRFRGNLFGLIPVDYSPTSLPPPIPLPIVFFTNPDIQLVLVTTDVLTAKPKLTVRFARAE